ncbi:hypothetical protein LY78DRAFT_671916 [Colletotrichum sublineola]|nr:hypothetical protein LY78DRAFT_671916 [Colletotrichum sublineola]
MTQPGDDAAPSKTNFEETWTLFAETKQTAEYLEQAVSANPSLVYTANGDATQIETFKTEAEPKSITVLTKHDLLGGENGLEKLQGDQQALVDFLVLLSASQFSGAACSSFSWNVALKRQLLAQSSKEQHRGRPRNV